MNNNKYIELCLKYKNDKDLYNYLMQIDKKYLVMYLIDKLKGV